MSAELIERIRVSRMSWIDLGDGKRLRVIRPPEADFADFLFTGQNVTAQWAIDRVVKYAEGWDGFSEADLMGKDIAPSDIFPLFTKDLCRLAIADNQNWLSSATAGLLDIVRAYIESKTVLTKN